MIDFKTAQQTKKENDTTKNQRTNGNALLFTSYCLFVVALGKHGWITIWDALAILCFLWGLHLYLIGRKVL